MKKFTLLCLTAIAMLSCSDDDDATFTPLTEGWLMINASNGFGGINNNIVQGTVSWNFDEVTHKLHVINQNTANDEFDGPDTGEYSYTIGSDDSICNETLTIDNTPYGCIQQQGDTLIVNYSFVDGDTYTFVRGE